MNPNCTIEHPFTYKKNNMSWSYTEKHYVFSLLLFIYLVVAICYCLYKYVVNKVKPSNNFLVVNVLLLCIFCWIFCKHQLIALYIPSSFLSFFTRTPEFLDKDKYFPNYVFFEDKNTFAKLKNEVQCVLDKTNNGNNISLTREKIGGFNEYIGSDVKLDDLGTERGWRLLNIKLGSNYSPDAVYFPTLVELLDKMPEVKACALSILEPGVHIPIHVGYYKGVMRFMLPIFVPKRREDVYLCVNGNKYHWTEGQSVLWDDTFPHSVYNTTDEIRVVFYMDIERPYPGILKHINRTIINVAANSDVIQRELKKTEIQQKI